jgi:predicted transcriptional regulator
MSMIIRSQKTKIKKHNCYYDSLYDALIYLNNHPIPLTKYRITTNKSVLSSLFSYELITMVTDRNMLSSIDHNEAPHYTISPKGVEFIRRYESLHNLLTE